MLSFGTIRPLSHAGRIHEKMALLKCSNTILPSRIIPKFIHAPGAPPRRFGDPGWDRDCPPNSEFNEPLGNPTRMFILLGVGQGGGETPSCLRISLKPEGFQQSRKNEKSDHGWNLYPILKSGPRCWPETQRNIFFGHVLSLRFNKEKCLIKPELEDHNQDHKEKCRSVCQNYRCFQDQDPIYQPEQDPGRKYKEHARGKVFTRLCLPGPVYLGEECDRRTEPRNISKHRHEVHRIHRNR